MFASLSKSPLTYTNSVSCDPKLRFQWQRAFFHVLLYIYIYIFIKGELEGEFHCFQAQIPENEWKYGKFCIFVLLFSSLLYMWYTLIIDVGIILHQKWAHYKSTNACAHDIMSNFTRHQQHTSNHLIYVCVYSGRVEKKNTI